MSRKRSAWGLLLLLLVSASLCGLLAKTYWPGSSNDDVAYVAAARSMVLGQGYTSGYNVLAGLEAKYPPGYPLFLTPAQYMAPTNIGLMRILNALCGLFVLGLIWQSGKEFGPPVAVLTGVNAFYLHFSSMIMSEVFFMLLMYALLAWLGRALQRQCLTSSDRVGLALLLTLSVLTRTVGIVLVPAVVFAIWHKWRDWKQCLAVLLYTGGLYAPYLVASRISGYREDLFDYPGIWVVVKENLSVYFTVLPGLLLGDPIIFRKMGSNGTVSTIVVALICALVYFLLAFGLKVAWSQGRVAEVGIVVLTGLLLAFWPFQYPRFSLPLLPLLYVFLLLAIDKIGAKIRARKLVARSVAALCLLELTLVGQAVSTKSLTTPASYRWIQEHTQKDDAICTSQIAVWLYTERKVLALWPYQAATQLEYWINLLYQSDIRYLIIWPEFNAGELVRSLQSLPQHFMVVYSDPREQVLVFQVVGDAKKYREAYARASMGIGLLKAGNLQSGGQAIHQSLQSEDWFLKPRLILTESLISHRDFKAAESELLQILQRYPANPQAGGLLRSLNLKNGN